MTQTILILLFGLGLLLVGMGLLGTLVGVRATVAGFSNIEIGLVMTGYYAGYIVGTLLTPGLIRNVGHIRVFAAYAALGAVAALTFGLLIMPWTWLLLRSLSGFCVVGLYMVVESWLNEQSAGHARGRIFSVYMTSTLLALGGAQFLLLVPDHSGMVLFALASMLISLGAVPIALNRLHEPRIEASTPLRLVKLARISPLGTVGTLGAGVLSGAFWGMAPVFAQRLALGEAQIALLMGATILGGALLQWPLGHFSDTHDRRKVLVATSFATAVMATLTAFIVMRGHPGLALSSLVYGGLMFALYGISVAHTNDHLEPPQVLEATRGLLLVYGVGSLAGPLFGGVSMEFLGPVGLPLVSATTAVLLGLYGIYRIRRREAPPAEEKSIFVPLVRTTPVVLEMMPDADPETAYDVPPPEVQQAYDTPVSTAETPGDPGAPDREPEG